MSYDTLRGASAYGIEKTMRPGGGHGDQVSIPLFGCFQDCVDNVAGPPHYRHRGAVIGPPDGRRGFSDVHQLNRSRLRVHQPDEVLNGVERL